jgi:hypothetical protein
MPFCTPEDDGVDRIIGQCLGYGNDQSITGFRAYGIALVGAVYRNSCNARRCSFRDDD